MGRDALERRRGPGPRIGGLVACAVLATAALAGCEHPAGSASASHVEAWQADVPARFTFPPVGLEEFAMARKDAGSLRLVIHIGADGALERLDAEQVVGLDPDALEELFATIRRARFAPAMIGGRQVASIKRIALDFDPLASRIVATTRLPDGAR